MLRSTGLDQREHLDRLDRGSRQDRAARIACNKYGSSWTNHDHVDEMGTLNDATGDLDSHRL